MDVKKDIVAEVERLLIHRLQFLNVEPNAIKYDLIGMHDLYSKIKGKTASD